MQIADRVHDVHLVQTPRNATAYDCWHASFWLLLQTWIFLLQRNWSYLSSTHIWNLLQSQAHYRRKGNYVFMFVSLSICLITGLGLLKRLIKIIFMEFYRMVAIYPERNRLHFEWPWPNVKITVGQKSKSFCE